MLVNCAVLVSMFYGGRFVQCSQGGKVLKPTAVFLLYIKCVKLLLTLVNNVTHAS
jgi:hypothetical protein